MPRRNNKKGRDDSDEEQTAKANASQAVKKSAKPLPGDDDGFADDDYEDEDDEGSGTRKESADVDETTDNMASLSVNSKAALRKLKRAKKKGELTEEQLQDEALQVKASYALHPSRPCGLLFRPSSFAPGANPILLFLLFQLFQGQR